MAQARTRKAYHFVVLVADLPTPPQAAALVALSDRPVVLRRVRAGTGEIEFRRTGTDLLAAVVSAVDDLEAVGLRPVRLLNDDWVTLADIADRVGRSRETVRLWATGRLGPGGFPPPLNPHRDTSFYSWVEVSTWLRRRHGMRVRRADPARVAADLMVRLRALPR